MEIGNCVFGDHEVTFDVAESCNRSSTFDVKCPQCGPYSIASTLEIELRNQQRWTIERDGVAAAVQWALGNGEAVRFCSMQDVLNLMMRYQVAHQ